MKISSVVQNIKASGIRRFFDLAESDPDVISLGVGEPDFVTPQSILKAAERSLYGGFTHYTSNDGMLTLRQKISDYLKKKFGLVYNPEGEIIVTVGASEAVDIALTTLLSPGDEVLIPEPCFVSYTPCASLCGARPVAVPTSPENGFKVTAQELEKRVSARTRALIISYPNNPTGAVMNRQELAHIADFVKKYDLAVVSDEVYAELTYERRHASIAALPGMKERTFLIGGFSKAFAMTGWRIGYLCGPHDAVQAARKVHQYRVMCPPTISQIAAIEALSTAELEVRRMREEYDRRRKEITRGMKSLGLEVAEPGGAFYIFPSIRNTGLSSEEFAEKLLLSAKVAVVPGNAFGLSGEGHIRCSYATSMENIHEALNRMEAFLKHKESQIISFG
ncbi:aminotransferase class I/II-fold pyridoxal phosphate-dependent enzyme [Thermoanaerobacterium sp. DL9XJH110]|uniref:aminotransferase class I/II-fold pyridoxal phosphate-dependent enzyme n=1 Tax=Thermoanaerobacterium sp. DL9XJH110 TaxID=3386643 RepID=UPI003BB6B0F6